jgi:hypothetical protein
MIRRCLIALALPLCAVAQIQVSVYSGGTETPVTALTNVGSAAVGDSIETIFRVRNMGASSVAVQPITVAGACFSISSAPPYPYVLAPANFVEFRVLFSPTAVASYSANVTVDDFQFIISASGTAAPSLTQVENGSAVSLSAGNSIDFGRILKNTSESLQLTVSNSTASTLAVGRIAVSGAGFSGPTGITTPLALAPANAATFQITFAPPTAGQYNGTLTIDDRTFALTGIAYDPPFPAASIVVDASAATSGTQQGLEVQLAAPSGVSGPGLLHMDFQSAVPGVPDDPAIEFVDSGSRDLSFTINEGDTVAKFGSSTDVMFQTGTTAGVITFTLTLGNETAQTTVVIAPAAVAVATASGTRRVSDLDITISGFDNTRTAGQMRFTFWDTNGNMVQPGAITSDFGPNFEQYFANSTVGGAFLARVTFPVTGDASTIAGVDVEMTNSAGTTKLARITF